MRQVFQEVKTKNVECSDHTNGFLESGSYPLGEQNINSALPGAVTSSNWIGCSCNCLNIDVMGLNVTVDF